MNFFLTLPILFKLLEIKAHKKNLIFLENFLFQMHLALSIIQNPRLADSCSPALWTVFYYVNPNWLGPHSNPSELTKTYNSKTCLHDTTYFFSNQENYFIKNNEKYNQKVAGQKTRQTQAKESPKLNYKKWLQLLIKQRKITRIHMHLEKLRSIKCATS